MKRLRRKLLRIDNKEYWQIVLVLTILQEMEVGVVNVALTIESVVLRHCVIQKTWVIVLKNLKDERNLSSIYKVGNERKPA